MPQGEKIKPIWEAIPEAMYHFLRNFKGYTAEEVLKMPSPRFWYLIDELIKEAKETQKEMKKLERKNARKHNFN